MRTGQIILSGKHYKVRVKNFIPQVLVDDQWINRDQFINHLEASRDANSLNDLAKIGENAINGEIDHQRTATELHSIRNN